MKKESFSPQVFESAKLKPSSARSSGKTISSAPAGALRPTIVGKFKAKTVWCRAGDYTHGEVFFFFFGGRAEFSTRHGRNCLCAARQLGEEGEFSGDDGVCVCV